MRRIELCRFVNGDTKVTVEGSALLLGITADELRAVCPSLQAADLPDYLQRKGKKRAKSAADAVGSNVTTLVLGFWAVQTWDCRIDFDEAAQQMWAVLDEEPA